MYEIQEAEGLPVGTKIVVHLKTDCREFSDDDTVKSKFILFKSYENNNYKHPRFNYKLNMF